MEKYLLTEEKRIINELLTKLNILLPNNYNKLIIEFIKNNKDKNIDDILNILNNNLNNEMITILEKEITRGIEYGIKNNYFTLSTYTGYQSINDNKLVKEDTLFSIDSISKIFTSTITMQEIRNNKLKITDQVKDYNPEFKMDATIESILKFTAFIRTSKRIDYLSKEETINILKEAIENKEEKNKYHNYYQYNDIGIMILRQAIPNFLEKLDNLLEIIDNKNLKYKDIDKNNTTGGKIKTEYITPDSKGRDIPFPGHTGMYATIEGLLNLYYKLIHTELLLKDNEKKLLWKQPYTDPHIYNLDNSYKIGINKTIEYMNKIAGIYRIPTGITEEYDKLLVGNVPSTTTNYAKASAGTCGSWVMADKLLNNYSLGILTNPYSYIENGTYPEKTNQINNNFTVTNRGVIINYPKKLREYKEILVKYAIILDALTEYIKITDKNIKTHKLIKKNNYYKKS